VPQRTVTGLISMLLSDWKPLKFESEMFLIMRGDSIRFSGVLVRDGTDRVLGWGFERGYAAWIDFYKRWGWMYGLKPVPVKDGLPCPDTEPLGLGSCDPTLAELAVLAQLAEFG
jgi:hypothetical protein